MSDSLPPTDIKKTLGGRYKVIGKLGAGGFGQTFLAKDLHLPGHPRCALKQLKPQTTDDEGLAMARRLFDTEAQVLYQLGSHDQIPRLLAHFEEDREFYLAQELIEGEPLSQELGSKHWSQTQTIALLRDILQVLAFVHEKQVIHRDIKPPNLIRRRDDGAIVLIDFGAVKQVSTHALDLETGQTNITISIGTQGYMPNEQLAGKPRFSSDIYAVGTIGIQALTGRNPKHLRENLETGELEWRSLVPHASPELIELLDRMVRYDFRDRYPTAVEALEALENLPAPLLDSLPPPSVGLREYDEDEEAPDVEAPTKQAPPLETREQTDTEQPEEGEEIVPTNSPEPVDTPIHGSPNPHSSDPTEPLSQFPPPTPEPAEPETAPESRQRQWIKPLAALAVLVVAGLAFVFWRETDIFNQQASQPEETPRETPSPSPASPSPTIPPEQQAAQRLEEANTLRESGQYEEALAAYDEAIALNPDLAEAYWGRCHSLNELGQPTEATVACNDALALRANYAAAIWGKANALRQQDRIIEALRLYEQATNLNPELAGAWIDYGMALQDVGRSVEAIEALDKGIALKRDAADAWSTKGEALWNLGRYDEAIAALDKALQLDPNHPEAKPLREQIRQQLGR
jgi:serine/threonine protein kinase